MTTLAVLVHHDPDGEVAPHVRYAIDRLRAAADRLVFVTTCALTAAGRGNLDTVDEVIERENVGYDFYSWRTGLKVEAGDHERVILANDSFVGPLIQVSELLADMTSKGADSYGITTSPQGGMHVQSYFTVFGPAATRHPSVQAFWREMEPVDDRAEVIERYELGLGRVIAGAGLSVGSYFQATPHEERVMAARMASFHRTGAAAPVAAAAAYALQPMRKVVESPILGLWDRVFDDARLPAVKVSLFSRNPYRIDREEVLARLTDAYPDAFEGFGAYLRRIGVTW